jgi:hypothetical protein
MNLLKSVLLVAVLAVAVPVASHAQLRVQVNIGTGRYHGYNGGYGYHQRYRVARCRAYSRYGCYPSGPVIVRRSYRPAPVIVVRPRYRRIHRNW